MDPLIALVPSPLLGSETWEPVRQRLEAAGRDAEVLAVPPDATAGPDDVLRALLAALPRERHVVLVPHSNAGLYVAALAAGRAVDAVVFVDAGLPAPDGPTPTAPAALLPFLAAQADDAGVLPPWTQWWPEQDVAALFPDDDVRARVERQQPRLPLAYFHGTVPAPPGWAALPCAYLAFGSTYADEAARATAEGWVVSRVPGRHLHMLVDPDGVAAELDRLLRVVTGP